jgi:hypothetical protein
MNKIEILDNGDWIVYNHHRIFSLEQTHGPERLQIGIPHESIDTIFALLKLMPEPLLLLYVLHTPRGAEPGRYQSPDLSHLQVKAFFDDFGDFLQQDSRHDLWIYSPGAKATLVWDRHNILYAYGPINSFVSTLERTGYTTGFPSIPYLHRHCYHPDFDQQQYALLNAFDWYRTELRPEDEQ